jgi:hypothetical protein
MPSPIRIWLEISHHGPFRMGGWAWVREAGGEVTGQAGGERRIEAERAALAGLAAALEGVKAATLYTTSAAVAAKPRPPGVQVIRVQAGPGTPSAFAAGWAEFARDKAKDQGDFASPIPKANLAKAGV